MAASTSKPKTVAEYVAMFPKDVQSRLNQIRRTIKQIEPDAVEAISYGMPAFKQDGIYFVGFAAWKNYISMYPAPSGTEAFDRELSQYRAAKSTIQFPLDKPLPLGLIRKIVKYRLKDRLKRKREKWK